MPKEKWNLHTMNEYAIQFGYEVLETKWIFKPYQKQRWALVQCHNKNHVPYWVWWNNFLNNYRCKKCDYEKRGLTTWTKEDVINLFDDIGCELLNINEWKNVDDKISYRDKDGFKYSSSITGIKQCGKSSYRFNSKNEFAIENIDMYCKLYRPEYELLSIEYKGIKKEYIWQYNGPFYNNFDNTDIERTFVCTADNFINGNVKHPNLTISRLALEVIRVLEKYNICYEREKSFSDCKDKYVLRFDFCLYLDDGEIVLIEADGEQHEHLVAIWDTKDSFEDRKRKDKIKDTYCKINDIRLIRISEKTKEKYRRNDM